MLIDVMNGVPTACVPKHPDSPDDMIMCELEVYRGPQDLIRPMLKLSRGICLPDPIESRAFAHFVEQVGKLISACGAERVDLYRVYRPEGLRFRINHSGPFAFVGIHTTALENDVFALDDVFFTDADTPHFRVTLEADISEEKMRKTTRCLGMAQLDVVSSVRKVRRCDEAWEMIWWNPPRRQDA